MKDYVRTFIGCRIVRDKPLNAVLDPFEKCHPEFRPVVTENLHVTVCFLGELHIDTAEEYADLLTDHLTAFAAAHGAGPITVQPIETVTVYSSQLAAGGSMYTPRREIRLQ